MEIKEMWAKLKDSMDLYISNLDREINIVKRAAAYSDTESLILEFQSRLTEAAERSDSRNIEMEEEVKLARIERTIMNTLKPYALTMYMMLSQESPGIDEVD